MIAHLCSCKLSMINWVNTSQSNWGTIWRIWWWIMIHGSCRYVPHATSSKSSQNRSFCKITALAIPHFRYMMMKKCASKHKKLLQDPSSITSFWKLFYGPLPELRGISVIQTGQYCKPTGLMPPKSKWFKWDIYARCPTTMSTLRLSTL